MVRRQLLLLSSSQVHGYDLMQHPKEHIISFFNKNNVTEVIFVPYAKANGDYDGYTKTMGDALSKIGFPVKGLHTFSNPVEAVNSAQAIYVGGGNTFVLLKKLYELNLVETIRKRVFEDGMPYMGSSAGSNVATKNIKTTNDMPIVYPPSLDALNLVPFNINPHYYDADENSTHNGETREGRIIEFLELNDSKVLGLREGTMALVDDDKVTLLGTFNARVFTKNEAPQEFIPGSDLTFLIQ